MNGTVKCLTEIKVLLYCKRQRRRRCVVHFSAIAAQGYKSLQEGQKVAFDVETDPKNGKPRAAT